MSARDPSPHAPPASLDAEPTTSAPDDSGRADAHDEGAAAGRAPFRRASLHATPRRGRRAALYVLLAAALAVYFVLSPRWPKDQVFHLVLGNASPQITEVRVRYGEAKGSVAEDWTREASFRYALNSAPRVITHEPRLPDGDYVVEIDLVSPSGETTVRRRVTFASGTTTSIDVAGEALP